MIKIYINPYIASKEEIQQLLDTFEIIMLYNNGGWIL